MPFAERRKYPRIPETVSWKVTVGSSIYATQTRNLSCGGALCQLPQSLPVMTKLEIAFDLPPGPQGHSARSIRCIGVVVRQESRVDPQGIRTYLTAIYFLDLKVEDRQCIAEFVLRSMLAHDDRRS